MLALSSDSSLSVRLRGGVRGVGPIHANRQSLSRCGTELVAALGLTDNLVGVSHECDHPRSVSALPRLTSSILDHGLTPAEIDAAVRDASLEKRPLYAVDGALLARLQPDLIVTQGVCAVCAVTEDTVGSSLALLPVELSCDAPVLSLEGVCWDGVRRDIMKLGQATQQQKRATALLASLDARWAALTNAPPLDSPPRVAMLEWPDPPWFGGHWVPEQVAVAGGIDPFGVAGAPSGRLTFEQVREADPEFILGIACGYGVEENRRHLQALLEDPRWAGLRALVNHLPSPFPRRSPSWSVQGSWSTSAGCLPPSNPS